MENQGANGSNYSMLDRISQLPQPVLHNILSFLPQNEAVETCVLSKPWRYLGSTRPNFELNEGSFTGSKEAFMSVLDKSLQRYHDNEVSVQEFFLSIYELDSNTVLLLKKWIPTLMLNMGVKRFKFYFISYGSEYFDLPSSVVFKSKSLQELSLKKCKLSQINSTDKVLLMHLKNLSLTRVYIADETFEKIMSSCLLIEYVSLIDCEGLRAIKVNKTHNNLKCFTYASNPPENGHSIKINAPTVETIRIIFCSEWFHPNDYFQNLKSLHLCSVKLSNEWFNNFSCYFPCLEELNLCLCFGFKKFKLSSCSIKCLIIEVDRFVEAAIDAKNIRYFKHASSYVPSISFTEILGEWESHILVSYPMDLSSTRFLKLYELLKALSRSKISLNIDDSRLVVRDSYGGFYEPVVIQNFSISVASSSPFVDFLNFMFCIFHPKIIERFFYVNASAGWERKENQLTEFMCKILLIEREMRHYFSQQNLEEVSMEASNENEEEWHVVQGISFLEECALANEGNLKIRFRLKWGGLSYLPRVN